MPMRPADAVELVRDELWPLWRDERERLDRIDRWYRWDPDRVPTPRTATRELKTLVDLSTTPWLRLVVSTVAQALRVDGYRSPERRDNSRSWEAWQRNGLEARQVAIHRAALAYGYSFVTVLPGEDDQGNRAAVIRGVSPRKMQAVYADPAEDDWPMYAVRFESSGDGYAIRLYDEEAIYFLSADKTGGKVEYIEYREHNIGVCPVVRYANLLDLDGRAEGEVEPFIPLAARINKTAFDRLMTQHFNSWKVRTVAGMSEPDTEEEANLKKLKLRQDDILIAEDPDTKFGSLPETPLDGFIRAHESDIRTLAAASQTPTYSLTGDMINLSAEGIEAARADFSAKVEERKLMLGRSHDQMLRLSAYVEGDDEGAQDYSAHVTWQDYSVRTLSQAVDALGKAAQLLGVPPKALWARIPGVTKADVDEWEAMAAESDGIARLLEQLSSLSAEERATQGAVAPVVAGGVQS